MKRFLFVLVLLLALTLGIPGGAGTRERAQLTVCCYNLRNYLKMERSVAGLVRVDEPKPQTEIDAVVRFLANIQPDVLGVSEIGKDEDLTDLQTRLKEAGLDLPNREHTHGGDSERQLGLLTRFAIVARNSQTDLKYRIGEDIFPLQRGILDVTLQPRSGFFLRCVGVHLKSKRPVPEADESLMRRNEAHVLHLYLDKILEAAPDTHLLLYGDFNDLRNSPPIQEIEGVRGSPPALNMVPLQDRHQERWTHYWELEDLYSRLDYVFVSRALSPYVNRSESSIYDPEDYYQGSDHRPLVVKIHLTKR